MYTLTQFVLLPLALVALGTIPIMLLWTIVTLVRARRGDIRDALLKSLPEAIGAMGVVAILAFALVPNAGVETTVNLIPVKGLASNLFSSNWGIALVNAVGNLALFVPIGIAVRWRFNGGLRRAALAGAALSLTVELLQFVANDGRSVDVDDVLLNICGALLGAAVTGLVAESASRSS